jgi:phosphoglycolate phosphatase-like HAD superfamily hydrolase
MTRRRERNEPRERRSPTATVANYSDDFIVELDIPPLPEGIPQRLEEAIRARVTALLFRLREAKQEQYIKVLEVRLVREAYQAVLTAHELGIADSEVLYANFRHLVEDLDYEPADIGFVKKRPREETTLVDG